jgi:hypothetical protein
MKKIILTFLVLMMGLWSFPLFSQVENEVVALGLPGDNLNLYAVLDIFQNAKTIEEFEIKLNSRDSNVNNLDLNNDNAVDYISVISYNQGHFHSIVLRVAVNSDQFQDLAVIEVSKNNAGRVIVQIIGDEALYGRDYVVEPTIRGVSETPNPGYIGDRTIIVNNNVYGNGLVYVNEWPIIGLLFSPAFSMYASPWHWGFYPGYWNPWRPLLYYNYWGLHNHHYRNHRYRRTSYVRFPSHHSNYLRRRATSSIVTRNRNTGTYRGTYGGRNFRQPVAPPRVSRRDIRRENRRSTRQRMQSSTRPLNRTSTRQESRRSTRQRVQPPAARQNKQSTRQRAPRSKAPRNRPPTRQRRPPSTAAQNSQVTGQQNRPLTRQQTPSSTAVQNRPLTRQENGPSARQQARPVKSQTTPSLTRQANRQVRQAARQSAREARRSNRSGGPKDLP